MYGNYYNGPRPMYRQRLTAEQATDIALQRVPGQVVHLDMDLDDGMLKYEIFIMTQENRIYEVEVAAKNGAIIKIEEEDFD